MKRGTASRGACTVLLSTAVMLYGLPTMPVQALTPGTPEAIATAHGLATFAVALDALGGTPAFATKLPLTDRSPADILGFPTLFTRGLGTGMAAFDGDYDDLETAIAGASGNGVTYTVPGGITETGDVATFTVHAVVTREQQVPMSYVRPGGSPDDPDAQPAIVVHGGAVPVELTLTADLPFRMDKSIVQGTDIDLPHALSLDPAGATLTLSTGDGSSADDLSFVSRYGFTDVTVTGSAAYDLTGATTFADPDANGAVTVDEWTNTLLPDWARFALADTPGADAVNVSLTFDSTLLPSGTHGGTLTYVDAGAPTYVDLRPLDTNAPAPGTPIASLANLDPFTRVGADDALTGLSQFAAALEGAQARIDQRLPLLDKKFSEAFSPAGELQRLVEHQGSAAIVCGKANTQPPTGADLAGTTWYCQAVTKQDVTNVRWHRADGTTTGITGATTGSTVGQSPTTNITVADVAGEPDVAVDFDVTAQQPDGTTATQTFSAEPRIRSAQELQSTLDEITGSTITVAYDAAAETLTYDVAIAQDPAAITAGYDVGDALRPRTGLSGLKPKAATAPVSLDVGTTSLRAAYGLLLQSDRAALDSDALNAQVDRYFTKLGTGHEISVGTVTVSGVTGAVFDGRVGYLAVDATTTEWALAPAGTGDVLAADLATDAAHPVAGRNGVTIPDAVSLRRLLGATNPVTPTYNLSLDAALDIDAAGDLSALTTGTDQASVDVEWHDVAPATAPVTDGNAAYDTYLKLFDVLPLVEGKATGAKSAVTLTDDDTDFTTAFGHNLAVGAKLPATLQNGTTGATCEDVTVTSAHVLTCNSSSTVDDGTGTPTTIAGMAGGRRVSVRTGTGADDKPTYADADGAVVTTATTTDQSWRPGDTWRVSGDPDALRPLLLENLYDIANRLDLNTNPDYVTPLPMVGLTPRELTPQFAKIREIATAIAGRVPVTAQAPSWRPATAYALNDLTLPIKVGTLLFKATTAGTSGAAEPTWPATAGGTVTDGTVTWTAVAPAPTPPATLQELLAAIRAELSGVTAAVAGISLLNPEVGLTLATLDHKLPDGTTLDDKPHAELSIVWDGAAIVDAPVTMDLAPLSSLDLHGIPDENGVVGALNVSTTSEAKIRFAVPLSPDIPSGDVVVRADTGVSALTATVDDTTVDLTASVGSMALALGGAARLFGRHQPVTGTHTAGSVLTGTLTAYKLNGTAGAGSTASTLSDPATDFVAKGVLTGATVTSGANTCTVTGVAQHTLTCALNNSAAWASGNAYALSQNGNAKTATAAALAAPGFTSLVAGDVLRQGSASCAVTASTAKTQNTVDCPISSGTWDSGSAFTVERGSVLTDGDRTGANDAADASIRPFTSFPGSAGAKVTNTSKSGANCSTGTITGTTVACSSGTSLSSGAVWTTNDTYRYDVGDPAKVLVDPGAGFDGMGLVGRTLTNTTDNATCVVASATKDSLTCAAALTGSATWDADDYYEVQGPKTAKANLTSWTLTGAVDDDPEAYTTPTNLTSSAHGALIPQSCSDSATGNAVSGDACAVLAAQLVDPNAAHGTAGSVAGSVVTRDATAGPASLTTAGIKAGTVIRDATAQFNCVVTAATATTFTCPAPSGKSWAAGHVWRVDEGKFVGVLTYTAAFAAGTSTAGGLGSAFTSAVAGDEPLQFSLLTVAMNLLRGYVEDGLDGTLAAEPFPLVGLDRTAGSHVMDALQALEDTLAENPGPAFTPGPNSMVNFKAQLETYLSDAITSLGTLGKVLSPKNAGNHDTGVTVLLKCKKTPSSPEVDCADGTHTDENISDVRLKTTIGGDAAKALRMSQGCTAATCDANVASIHLPRFDTGLPGLELDGPNGLDAEVGWTFDLDFGMARDVGPYIGTTVTPSGGTADPALEIGASVHLPATSSCPTATLPAGAAAGQTAEETGSNGGFSQARCYQATLGLLQGIVYDGTGDPLSDSDGKNADRTGLSLLATVDLSPAAGSDAKGRISLDTLSDPQVAIPSFKADAAGNIDLYFVTGVALDGSPAGTSLPSLQGTLHVGFDVHGVLNAADSDASAFTDLSYADLQMDAGSFVNEFMAPIVAELYALTRPFKTVADILMAPIPVLKEIAALTGQKLGTLLDLLEEAARGPLALVRSVIGIVQLISDLAARASKTLVGLGAWGNGVTSKGGFKVAKKDATKGACGKTVDGKKQPKDCTKSFKQDGTKYKQSVVQLGTCPANGCTGKELARTMTRGTQVKKFDGMGITFPFLNDTSAVMGLLVGEHATLVRFDPGAFGVSASLQYSWGPFMAGPVPVEITIGGTIGLEAHFAVGYDTRGIYNLLKQDRDSYDPSALADGIFIDDLDLGGSDVDEIKLTFVVTLGASVSISVFKVGLYGGVGITIGFDLVDPDHDGKLYIDEIEQFKDNPICLFKVQGLLDFFFGFFVEIDLKLWSKRWDFELFRLKPPIKLFEVECQRFEPDLAVAEGGNLRLNIGDVGNVGGHTYAFNRHYKSTRTQEKFVVRQLAPVDATKPTPVQVEFSGLVQNDTVPAGGRILADAGTGNDVVELASGATEDGTEIPFTVAATVNGWSGDDQLTTGDGDDTVNGDHPTATTGATDNDKVSTGAGDDTATGGRGDDNVDGGLGNDVVSGGGGTDRVNGNAGADYVAGGADDDTLNGGPGLNATQAATARSRNPKLTEAGAATLLDGADVLVGDAGADTLSGHFGDDHLFGGSFRGVTPSLTERQRLDVLRGASTAGTFSFATACATELSGDGDDQLNGETGNDVLVGDTGSDRLAGGLGGDSLCGGSGSDLLEGDAATGAVTGDDTLLGGADADQLFARGGSDVLDGGAGPDLVDAGDGNDRATGGLGADAIDAGNGSDIVVGDTGTIAAGAAITTSGSQAKTAVPADASVNATAGAPIVCRPSANVLSDGKLDLDGDGAADSGRFLGRKVVGGVVKTDTSPEANLSGTVGDRVVTNGLVQGGASSVAGLATALRATSGADSDCIVAGAGHDAVFAGPGDDTVVGDAGLDYLRGDSGSDYVRGYSDADEIDGGAGTDDVYGDTGEDVVDGGADDDQVHGGIGNDVAYGGPGADEVSGEDGADVLIGGSATAATADGGDRIDGGSGADVIAGDNATPNATRTDVTLLDRDVIHLTGGFSGNDVLGGQTANDTVYGQGGDDTISGHENDDLLFGNDGADVIDGNGGNDRLVGGSHVAGVADGGDTMHGGQGTDTLLGDNGVADPAGAVTLHDLATIGGADTMWGDEANDALYGGAGTDTIRGDQGDTTGTGNDYVEGGPGADTIWGAGGVDRIAGGSAQPGIPDGGDFVHAGDGTDVVTGDNALVTASGTVTLYDADGDASYSGGDTIWGDAHDDRVQAQGGDDTVRGGTGNDWVEGNGGADTIYGEAGTDRLVGGGGVAGETDGGDTISGGTDADSIAGDNATIDAAGTVTPLDLKTGGATVGSEAGDDTITGDDADDTIYATGANDTVHGNDGADYVEGGSGSDTLYGDAGTDRIMGGSSTADVRDDGDTISGGAADDLLTGDNALITTTVTLLDLRFSGQTSAYEAGGDTISGDAGSDTIHGQSGDDDLHGNDDPDYVEGNGGDDTISGGAGIDRLIGGSDLANAIDGADTVHGNEDADVATGDNARITAAGVVTLHDEDVSGSAAPPADVSGPDTMTGDAGTDRMYGQGDGDTMSGGTANDVMEGNSGADTMSGDDGDDNLSGGTTRDGAIRDTGDTMTGGNGVDVMLGDNGVVAGSGATARWTFFDLDPAGPVAKAAADLAGGDTMNGDAGTDWLFGQGGDDTISGGGADDRVQGGGGADTIAGDAGADDLVGGSAVHYVGATLTALPARVDGADAIRGDDATASHGLDDRADVVVGDNGRIDRGALDPNTGDASRTVTLFDVAVVGGHTPATDASGADTVSGDNGRDVVLGGGADDTLHGNAGDDHLEGNAGADTITGDLGDDDAVGGSSSLANGVVRFTAPAATNAATVSNLADGNDTIDGNDGDDAVLADNGVVARTMALGVWTYQPAPFADMVKRTVQAPTARELLGAYGDDTVNGGAGQDELHGQLGNDAVKGDAGDDAVLGDLGRFAVSVNGTTAGRNGKAQTSIRDSAKFLVETVHYTGSLQRDAVLYDLAVGGTDTVDGGTGNDALHGGAGDDTLSGNAGATDADPDLAAVCLAAVVSTCDRDAIFGDDGDDWMWGGPDKDHLYGGYGSDHIDVVRPGTVNPLAKFKGPDVMYGGWQQDAMQADVSSPNPNGDDKLIDSTGVYNIYYVCEGAYGGSSVVRSPSPSMQSTLQALATADGATTAATAGTSGFNELSMVFTNQFSQNSSPAFLDSPGHFICA